jgi:hypothetical protein
MSMDVKVSDIYHWQQPEFEQKCTKWGLSAKGSVRELRERLTAHIRSCVIGEMDTKTEGLGKGSDEAGAAFSELSQGVRVF